MFVASNFLSALANILDFALKTFSVLIIIRALISWVNPDPYNFIVQFLNKITEPILYPIRRFLPLNFRFGIDISPIIAILIIWFLRLFLVRSLFDLSRQLG